LHTAAVADGLATPGGVRSYDYQRSGNKVAHLRALSSFPCAGTYKVFAAVRQAASAAAVAIVPAFQRLGVERGTLHSSQYFTRIILTDIITRV
jgi:hypothetical protein